jgi:nitrogenase molybdenum-iron protein alpha chain
MAKAATIQTPVKHLVKQSVEQSDAAQTTYGGVRELRPSTDTFLHQGGSSCDLAGRFKKRCMAQADRTFSQGQQCQQINSIATFLSMEDAAFIVHSPQGCAGCAVGFSDFFRVGQYHRGIKNPRNAHVFVSNLDEQDIVLGGEEKLRDTIRLVSERYHPQLLFIFASCASGIIGDDIEAVVASEQKDDGPLLIPIHCEGFKSNIPASGFDAAFIAIDKYLLKKQRQPKQKGLINLFAPTSISFADQTEMERILADIGLEANYLPFYASIDKLRKAASAEASTAICKVFADEFMKVLDTDYGVPYSHTVMPIGVRNTELWLFGIADLVGKGAEARAYAEREREAILPRLAAIREKLQGKRVFICGGTGRSFAAGALIDDFGMKLVGIETPTLDEDANFDIEHLNSIHGDYVLDVANMQPFEQVNLVKRLKPDVFIGVPSWSGRFGLPTTHVNDPKRPTMGYRGLLYLGQKMAAQLNNPGFNVKLSKYASLPYKESWYESDPFKFIKRTEEPQKVINHV